MCVTLAMNQGKTSISYSQKEANIAADIKEEQLKEFCEPPEEGKSK
jgi:hypothetical protein